ncbi:MAG: nuclear transport factor 2 family protein [Hyphomicrobiaceae bacterium]|nr:nuclear transport factor 2 family protein [Hyphomicrobiaceae bacterium]
MTASENKAAITAAFAHLARGDGQPFVALMAEDFTWIFKGSTNWQGCYRGKSTVRAELLGPLFANFSGTYTSTARRIIAEDDIVVVECEGCVATKAGDRYDNKYCYVIRMHEGKMLELTEYMDTALADRVLAPPRHA